MKRFEFSLDRLLKVKRQLERVAEREQVVAAQALQDAQAKVHELRGQLTRLGERLTVSAGQSVAPQQWAATYEAAERLGRAIVTAELAVALADQQLTKAAEERAQIATEVEALATLRQQQWDAWRVEFQKADQMQLDEVGLRRWMAAKEEAA